MPDRLLFDAFQAHLEPVLSGSDVVVKESDRTVVVRDEDIDSSVVVDVADRHATADVDALETLVRQRRSTSRNFCSWPSL